MNKKKELDKQFENPIVMVNIQTDEGYCRIREYWAEEGIETILGE